MKERQLDPNRPAKVARGVHAHPLVAKTAVAMAYSLYDDVMRDNTVYATWKKICPELTPKILELQFVKLMTPHLLAPARATLAQMLSMPTNAALHPEIHEALIADNTLRRGRVRV